MRWLHSVHLRARIPGSARQHSRYLFPCPALLPEHRRLVNLPRREPERCPPASHGKAYLRAAACHRSDWLVGDHGQIVSEQLLEIRVGIGGRGVGHPLVIDDGAVPAQQRY